MEELAQRVQCSKQAIGQYEKNLRRPDSKTLMAIANALDYETDYFYNTSTDVNFNLLKINYREGNQLSKKDREAVENTTIARLNEYLELEFISDEFVTFQNPLEALVIKNTVDAEKAAKLLRKNWKLGEGPIHNISNLLEKNGVRMIKIDYGHNYSHEGLSGWAEKNIPVIIINAKQKDSCRVRFTILHELAHLLLEIADNICLDTIEKICDAFAGAVLLSAEGLVDEFGKNRTAISMEELKRIKELYGISIIAIMLRASTTKLITWESYHKWKQSDFSHHDFGNYDGNEEPQKFFQMLLRCLNEKIIGYDKASQLAQKSQIELKQFYKQQLVF